MECLLCIFTIYIKAKIIVNKIQPHRNCPIHFLWRIIFILTNYKQLLLYISYEHWYGLYYYSLCISHSLLVIRGMPSHWTGLLRLIVCYTVLLYHHTYAMYLLLRISNFTRYCKTHFVNVATIWSVQRYLRACMVVHSGCHGYLILMICRAWNSYPVTLMVLMSNLI